MRLAKTEAAQQTESEMIQATRHMGRFTEIGGFRAPLREPDESYRSGSRR